MRKKRNFYSIPWSLNLNYSQTINKGTSTVSETINTKTLGLSGNIKITDKWKFGFQSGYDFTDKDFSYTSIDVYRDLHWGNAISLDTHRVSKKLCTNYKSKKQIY